LEAISDGEQEAIDLSKMMLEVDAETRALEMVTRRLDRNESNVELRAQLEARMDRVSALRKQLRQRSGAEKELVKARIDTQEFRQKMDREKHDFFNQTLRTVHHVENTRVLDEVRKEEEAEEIAEQQASEKRVGVQRSSSVSPRPSRAVHLRPAPAMTAKAKSKPKQQKEPCRFWMSGKCRKGKACRFSHKEPLDAAPTTPPHKIQRKRSSSSSDAEGTPRKATIYGMAPWRQR
jgi:hypothetical protein